MGKSGFPQLLENLEKPGIYFGSLNPEKSLDFFFLNLESPWYLWKTQKIDQLIFLFSFLNFILLLEILFMYNKVTTVFQKYPWTCAVDPLITLEIPLNFLIWDVWEPWQVVSLNTSNIFELILQTRWFNKHFSG